MKRLLLLLPLFFLAFHLSAQKKYKSLMADPSVNFYDVCEEAERYFSTIDKDAKGSGYKGYQRWKQANEYKYYPDGDRSMEDPYFVKNAFKAFLKTQASQRQSPDEVWEEIGPSYVDSLSGHYAVGLGRVEDLFVDPLNMNRIYLGSRSGGFWRSLDGGATWEGGLTDFLFASGVDAIAVDPDNVEQVLINVKNARNGYSHGIYSSADSGSNWTETAFNPDNLGMGGLGSNFRIYKIFYHPTIDDLVFVGTNKGLFRSEDNLNTWTQVYSNKLITAISFHPTESNIVYFLSTNGSTGDRDFVFKSTDTGVSFSATQELQGNANAKGLLSVSPDCPDCLFFASTSGVWKSTDQGETFSFLTNPDQSGLGFAVNDQDADNMVYGYVDMMRSVNGGNNFEQVTWWYLGNANHGNGSLQDNFENSPSYVHADLRIAKCINGVFYVGTDGFLCRSTDGGQFWEILSQGTGIRENYKLGASQSNDERVIVGSQDNGSSIKKEGHWLEFYGADGMECLIHPLNDDYMISSVQYGGRRRTFDGGLSQDGASPANQSGSDNAFWEAPIAYAPTNQMRLFNFSEVLYVSDEFGSNWYYKGSPSTFNDKIKQAAIAENNEDIVVLIRNGAIEKSVDGGENFFDIRNNLPNFTINDIAFHPHDDNTMIVVYGRYQNDNQKVFITTNGGDSWDNITHNLGNMPVHSVVIDHTDDANIYVGAEIGVYVKSMDSDEWTLFNESLPNCTMEELEIMNGTNTLKGATWGRGVWQAPLLGRADYPKIVRTTITDMPTLSQPLENKDQYVYATIDYDGDLSSVKVIYSMDNLDLDNEITMSSTDGVQWVSDTPIPGAELNTKVYFKVLAEASNGDITETYRFMFNVQPLRYCDATGSTGTTVDYITSVSLNGMVNETNQNYYTYYEDKVVELEVDSTYLLEMTLDYSFTEDDPGAWIDFNLDGEFSADEEIDMADYNGNHYSSGTFTVPSDALTGTILRLRVRNSFFGDALPCGEDAGEVEDYPVVISAGPTNVSQLLEGASELKLYPNPGSGIIFLSGDLDWDELRVFDVLGKDVKQDLRLKSNTEQLELDCSGLPNGVYWFIHKSQAAKFIKN